MFYAEIQEYEGEYDGPSPADAKLNPGRAYRILHINSGVTMDDEALFGVINEEGEMWFLSNRHFRVVNAYNFSVPLQDDV